MALPDRAVGLLILFVFALAACTAKPETASPGAVGRAPELSTVTETDDYHGTKIADPWRWLEDLDGPRTRAWIEAQNAKTAAFLAAIPERERIEQRLTKLWNYARYSPPTARGGRYFFSKNEGLQNQSVVYWSQGLAGEPKVLLDPNTLSADGTVSLADLRVSEDGRLAAYGLSSAGSDWTEWKVREVESGRDLPDQLRWVKFSTAAWLPDASGFYYARFPEPAAGEERKAANRNQKLYFHRLGTPQAEDRLVYERPDQPDWGFGQEVTEDGRYLIIPATVGTDTRNRVYYQDLQAGGPVGPLIEVFDATYDFVGNDGPMFWFRTNAGAPRFRLIAVDLRAPEAGNWTEIVPEGQGTLADVRVIAGRFVLTYLRDVHHQVAVCSLDGSPMGEVALPALGAIGGMTGRRKDTEAFFSFTSFAVPTTIYRYDFAAGRVEEYRTPAVNFNPADYVVRQEWYRSKDGTRIPMFLVHKKGIKPDGTNPTHLYGYGGFNIPMLPAFIVPNVVWLEMGGIFAQPALRGGGEYGEEWHTAGMMAKKQNVFDDFIAAAEWLIAERWTKTEKLAISGASNGGLLVGACMTQRPDLFGACLPSVGVLDMLRFHKFTIGWAWVSEYGSADDPEQFKVLRAYSPLHNLRPGTKYPATLISTADHDDRVVPAHSFKFAAALQEAQGGDAPALIRIETKAGHGAGTPMSKIIEAAADQVAFVVKVLGVKVSW